MIFKLILTVVSIAHLSVGVPVSSDGPQCSIRYDDEMSYTDIDCGGSYPVHNQMCGSMEKDVSKRCIASVVVLNNCIMYEEPLDLFTNDGSDITKAMVWKNNTFYKADFTSYKGLGAMVITDPKFKTKPTKLKIEASKMKWFEYDGKYDNVIDSIKMIDPIKMEFFGMKKTSMCSFSDDFFKNTTNLKMVFLPWNKIEWIDSINWPNSMKWLDVSWNKIAHLSTKSFEDMEHLKILSMKWNDIHEIEPGTFSKLHDLMYLSMKGNSIQEVKKGMFDGLSEVIAIDLEWNKIESIESGAFEATPKLEVLGLSDNKITHLNSSTFSGTTHLKFIDLSWNPIGSMALDTFAYIFKLENLDLSYCRMKFVDFNVFSNTWNLEYLDLSHNKIDHFIKMSPSHSTKISTLSETESGAWEAFKWMKPILDFGGELMSDEVKTTFIEVLAFSMGWDASLFADKFDWKNFNVHCPADDEFEETWKLKTLKLSGNDLTVIEKDVFAVFKNLKQLYLSNNPITMLYPESFAGLDKLTKLFMADCKLTTIDFSMFAHMTKLEEIDLSGNQLATIRAAPLPTIKILYMNDNQLTSFPMEKKDFPKLKYINVKNNKLVCTDMNTFVGVTLMCDK